MKLFKSIVGAVLTMSIAATAAVGMAVTANAAENVTTKYYFNTNQSSTYKDSYNLKNHNDPEKEQGVISNSNIRKASAIFEVAELSEVDSVDFVIAQAGGTVNVEYQSAEEYNSETHELINPKIIGSGGMDFAFNDTKDHTISSDLTGINSSDKYLAVIITPSGENNDRYGGPWVRNIKIYREPVTAQYDMQGADVTVVDNNGNEIPTSGEIQRRIPDGGTAIVTSTSYVELSEYNAITVYGGISGRMTVKAIAEDNTVLLDRTFEPKYRAWKHGEYAYTAFMDKTSDITQKVTVEITSIKGDGADAGGANPLYINYVQFTKENPDVTTANLEPANWTADAGSGYTADGNKLTYTENSKDFYGYKAQFTGLKGTYTTAKVMAGTKEKANMAMPTITGGAVVFYVITDSEAPADATMTIE